MDFKVLVMIIYVFFYFCKQNPGSLAGKNPPAMQETRV